MQRPVLIMTAALLLASAPALAGGDSSTRESPFADKKTPQYGTDPGFDMAVEFFTLFVTGRTLFDPDSTGNDLGGVAFSAKQLVDTRDYKHYEVYRNSPRQEDPGAEKRHYKAIGQIIAEYQAELGPDSPKAAKNLAPVDDPDALPGLDY